MTEIPVLSSSTRRASTMCSSRGVNKSNLTSIQCKMRDEKPITACLLNAHSIKNKTTHCKNNKADLKEYCIEQDIDIFAITETWLKDKDDHILMDITPKGYSNINVPRPRKNKGGGLALIYKSSIKVKHNINVTTYKTFELLQCDIGEGSNTIKMLLIYKPPSSTDYPIPFNEFLDDFNDAITSASLSHERIITLGDFNIHVDNPDNPDAKKFFKEIDTLDLKQHVSGQTHYLGHTLDLILTSSKQTILTKAPEIHDELSDHNAILFTLNIKKPDPTNETKTFRKIKAINTDHFKNDIHLSGLCAAVSASTNKYNTYCEILSDLLDQHAPKKTRTIVDRPSVPWINDTIKEQKRIKRRLERKWRKSKSLIDRESYVQQRDKSRSVIFKTKSTFYKSAIEENSSNPKYLFSLIKNLQHKEQHTLYPEHYSTKELVEDFNHFFIEKVMTIRNNIDSINVQNDLNIQLPAPPPRFNTFNTLTIRDTEKLTKKLKPKSSPDDPLPASLLKTCLPVLLAPITEIINDSFFNCKFPETMKQAVVGPRMKAPKLTNFKNYRPVSNLVYLSKLTEKAAAADLLQHMHIHELNEPYQSAYVQGHSTETALLKVQSDILLSTDKGNITLLILLDLSAAFDTIDHNILINRLHDYIGVSGDALSWFKSYLQDRNQCVFINNTKSELSHLTYGVPQGSVLGPILFSIYMLPLSHVIKRYNMKYHFYADDTQIYITFNPTNDNATSSITLLQSCINDVKTWMTQNKLKLNTDKTEFLTISKKNIQNKISIPELVLDGKIIVKSNDVRNLGAQFDSTLTMEKHIKKTATGARQQLYKIAKLKYFLDRNSLLTLINSFVISRIDYLNSLIYGVPAKHLRPLQLLLNSAARLLENCKRKDHISPILHRLKWLPIESRIQYKILIITYKTLQSKSPLYLKDLLVVHKPQRILRSDSNTSLVPPSTNLKTIGDRAFAAAAPKLWNTLPPNIRNSPTILSFKTNLKSFLLKQNAPKN